MTRALQRGEKRFLTDFTANTTVTVEVAFVMPGLTISLAALDHQRQFQTPPVWLAAHQPQGATDALSGTFAPEQVTFQLRLNELPSSVTHLAFLAVHDTLPVAQAKQLRWTLSGAVFDPVFGLGTEKAVVLAELYRHPQGWRVAAVGQGYAGGWPELTASFGRPLGDLELLPPAPPEDPAWEVQNEQGDVLLHLREAQPLDLRDAQPLPLSAEQRQDLGFALQGAVKLAVGAAPALMHLQAYRLVLGPEMQQAMREGAKMMQVQGGLTGFVRDASTGKILGAGNFRPDQLARFANVATIGFQIAAFVTAQYYLHNINKELKSIDRKLDGLQEFLETQATGRLLARVKGVERSMRLMQLRTLDAEERAAAQGDVLGLIREAESQIAQHELPFAALEESLKKSDQFKLEDAKRVLETHSKHMNTALFAAWTNIKALQLAIHLGWAQDRLQLHQEDLTRSLETLERATDVFAQGLTNFDVQARARRIPVQERTFSVLGAVANLFGRLTEGRRRKEDEQRETFKVADQGWVPTLTVHRQTLVGLRAGLVALEQHRVEVVRRQQVPLALVAQVDSHGQVIQAFAEGVAVSA